MDTSRQAWHQADVDTRPGAPESLAPGGRGHQTEPPEAWYQAEEIPPAHHFNVDKCKLVQYFKRSYPKEGVR